MHSTPNLWFLSIGTHATYPKTANDDATLIDCTYGIVWNVHGIYIYTYCIYVTYHMCMVHPFRYITCDTFQMQFQCVCQYKRLNHWCAHYILCILLCIYKLKLCEGSKISLREYVQPTKTQWLKTARWMVNSDMIYRFLCCSCFSMESHLKHSWKTVITVPCHRYLSSSSSCMKFHHEGPGRFVFLKLSTSQKLTWTLKIAMS